jgi:streptogramin lyase
MRRTGRFLLAITLGTGALDVTEAATRADLTIYMSAGGSATPRIDQVTPPGPRSPLAALPLNSFAVGVVFDPRGNLFVAGGRDVYEITPGGMVSYFATLPAAAGAYGIAIDPSGNLYVADSSLSEVSKIDPGGTVATYATLPGLNPTGLTFDALGNLYVSANGTIQKVAPGGGTATTYATLPTGSNNPTGLAFDAAGYLYSADFVQPTILRIAPGGGSISSFGATTSGAIGLTFYSSGNLYAAESSASRIEVIKPNGDTSLFADRLDSPRFLAIRPAAVPEPSSWAMLAAGLAVILLHRRLHAGARRTDGADAAQRVRHPMHSRSRRNTTMVETTTASQASITP